VTLWRSLKGRLLLASLLLLPLLLWLGGSYLERSYRLSLEAAQGERLQLRVLTLLAEAEYDGDLWLPEELLDRRFNQPGSGLYAWVSDTTGELLWASSSTPGLASDLLVPVNPLPAPGRPGTEAGGGWLRVSHTVLWATDDGDDVPLVFTVLESDAPVAAQLASYRRSLMIGLGGAALLLVLAQAIILGWSLRPLRQLGADIARIEAGDAEQLPGAYLTELNPVTDNLNTLLQGEQQRRERVRNTLSDLAHSLKTPLAVMRSADSTSADYPTQVGQKVDEMEQIVSYQLKRAAGVEQHLLQRVPIAPVAERLRATLLKVYAAGAPNITVAVPDDAEFRGDERDLMEMLGNLMDNACKYGGGQVRVCSELGGKRISVEDDGPGIPEDQRETLINRGARADSRREGQGIGLALVSDIAAACGGRLVIGDSELGGARFVLTWCVEAGRGSA
jgi:two-component system, OmpR family, sensor histidine kinase PhoQ